MQTKLDQLLEGLNSYAIWTREAQDDATPRHKRIDINDVDAELFSEAADTIIKLHAECKRWRKAHNQSTKDLDD